MDFDWRASQFELNFVEQGYKVHRFASTAAWSSNLYYVAKMMPSPIGLMSWCYVTPVKIYCWNLLSVTEPDQLFLGEWLATQRQANPGKVIENGPGKSWLQLDVRGMTPSQFLMILAVATSDHAPDRHHIQATLQHIPIACPESLPCEVQFPKGSSLKGSTPTL